MKALSPSTSALFISGDDDAGKVLCMAQVPKDAIAKGLKANEWCAQLQAILGGRGGGKPENAQATGTNVGATDKAMEAAVAYAMDKLGLTEAVTVKEPAESGDAKQ